MTQNQLAYHANQEKERANLAQEELGRTKNYLTKQDIERQKHRDMYANVQDATKSFKNIGEGTKAFSSGIGKLLEVIGG